LVAGLVIGLLLPSLAHAMVPWLPEMVAALLTITALRIGHDAVRGAISDLWWGLGAVATLQLALPLASIGALTLTGLVDTPAGLALVLVTATPAITGSPNLALLLGLDALRMIQIMILGTAVFPFTVIPVLLLSPQVGALGDIIGSSGVTLAVIIGSTALGFIWRAIVFPTPTPTQIATLDGASVLAFSVIAIGLVAPLNAALRATPDVVALWALLSFSICFGLQAATLFILRTSQLKPLAGPLAIGAGNRNIALFLVALPQQTMAPLMIFIACWQLPMYLTPILLPKLYQKARTDG
jgi:hypothetical protein